MVDFMKNIIKAKVPVWAYYGDTDIVCNFLIGERFATQLGITLLTPKTPWILDDQIGGTVTEYDGFTLLTVRGVGHMVPQWAPKRAFYILTQFLNQTTVFILLEWPAILFFNHLPEGHSIRDGHSNGDGHSIFR
uniref:Uncharacterized protein n=1 Tax=Meloidogyne enterolobii TaxID=390850 RepID=A0A6V7WW58_MELEN|nr:unnamed protein product [Meloidogyne enterolobii]